jgi:alkanesulfonate monooxygenase SsuD/methylene tetrahydromethanopterin reductase-like flavin-dependent oxidoreductase (luciferase family)
MKVDVMAGGAPLREVQQLALETQAAGFSGITFTEAGRTAYLSVAAAALAADRLTYGTGVAVAFPRSPVVTAATAWELADLHLAGAVRSKNPEAFQRLGAVASEVVRRTS